MAKQLTFNQDARDQLKKGLDQLANAVKVTMGPKGRNVVIGRGYGSPMITKDGVSVAKEIELEDPYENLGAELVKEVASKTNDVAGDGTTTATVLAQAIVGQGIKMVTAGANPALVKRGIDKAVLKIVENLKTLSKPVNTNEEIAQVASISANDKDIGKKIAEVIGEVSSELSDIKDVVITVEESQTFGVSHEVVKGMRFDRGYISPYMVTDTARMESEYNDPYILLYDKKISAVEEIVPILEKLAASGAKELVIIAEDIDGTALSTLVINKIRGTFNTLAIKAPGFGDRRKDMLEDIATLTGGKVISEVVGMKLETVEIADLGRARKVISDKDTTTVVEGRGDQATVKARAEQIRVGIKNTDSDFDREKLQERLAKLAGGVGVIKVGAATETEMKEVKQRIEDAIAATKAAVEEGIVPGGGVAYIRTLASLGAQETADDESMGFQILKRALEEPIRQIAHNAGQDGSVVVDTVKKNQGSYGYDAATNQYGDMVAAGIIDPTKVTRTALQNAASIAGLVLMTEALVADIPEKNPAPAMPGMGGGMPGMM